LARHARDVTDFLIRDVGLTEVQVDEMWSFVKKKQKNVDEGDSDGDRQGDCGIYIAKKADTKLPLAHSTGKRVQATADTLLETVRKRGKKPTGDGKATFMSDGNDQYIKAIWLDG
jgi:hypothetical protein